MVTNILVKNTWKKSKNNYDDDDNCGGGNENNQNCMKIIVSVPTTPKLTTRPQLFMKTTLGQQQLVTK